jgi:hypothetical protein
MGILTAKGSYSIIVHPQASLARGRGYDDILHPKIPIFAGLEKPIRNF